MAPVNEPDTPTATQVKRKSNAPVDEPTSKMAKNAATGQAVPVSRQAQKELRLQRKVEKSPSHELVHDLKKLWEKIRLKRMPRAERREFVAKSLVLVHKSGGTVTDLIFKHDASRIVQSLVKYSESKTERPQLLAALATHYVELAQSPYGRFVVLKALKYAPDAAARSRIIAEFCAAPGKGGSSSSVTRLIRHKYADVIVDTIYCVYANAKERQAMVEHFYGAEYAILKQSASIVAKDGTSGAAGKKGTAGKNNVTLATVLAQFPDKKERIVQQLKERLIGMVSKEGTVGRNEILHRVLFELFSNQSLEEVVGLVAQPTAPFHMLLAQLPSVVHTKPGSQLAMIVLAAMGAKERKLLLKALKPHAKAMACNEFGWMVLARVFDCVDDTVLVKTCILSEILGKDDDSCTELVLDPHARRALVYLLAGQTTKYFSPDLIALLNVRSAFLEQTSKKDATVRRRELLAVVVPRLASMMAASPTAAVDELMREISGCQLVLETMKGADEGQEAAVVGSLLSLLQPIYMKQAADDDAEKQQGVNGDEEESESDSDEEDEEDANEEKAETETPLEPSKHYVASKAAELAPVKVKAYLLFDQTASKYLKKMMAECPTFANRLGSALVEHEVVAKLAEMDLAALQSGPFFVHVNTLERLAESGDNKVHAALVKAMKKHLMPLVDSAPENKGLAFLNKMLTAAPVAGK